MLRWVMGVAAVLLVAGGMMVSYSGCSGGGGGDKTLTILWAQWPPADHLQALAREWGKANGVNVRVEQKSWAGAFSNAVQSEFSTNGQTYDIIVGDSQWLGLGVKGGHYLEVTDFIKANEGMFADTLPKAMSALCEYPAGSGRYYAVPCEADAMAWAYRKDLFEDAGHKARYSAFAGKVLGAGVAGDDPRRVLVVPETWEHLLLIARYFKEASGVKDMAGVAMPTSGNAYDSMPMMFQNVLWAHGGEYGEAGNLKIDSPETVRAMRFFKELMGTASVGGQTADYGDVTSAYISGNAAMCAVYFGFFPAIADPEQNRHAGVTGYFKMPRGPAGAFSSLGGQGMSINAHISKERQERAKEFAKWFSTQATQERWAQGSGCFPTHKAVLNSEAFRGATAYNAIFPESFAMTRDFWTIPEYDALLAAYRAELSGVFHQGKDPAEAAAAIEKRWAGILGKGGG